MAYSDKINDPSLNKYLKNTNNYKFIFSFGLAFIAVVGFYLYGEFGDDMDNPEALSVGLVIGGMFFLIGLFSVFSGRRKASWDGMVVEKKILDQKNKRLFIVYIENANNQRHEMVAEDDDTLYNYYKIGDKVRYHGKLKTFEKFDKSNDGLIFCNACAFMNTKEDDVCVNCGCVLLK